MQTQSKGSAQSGVMYKLADGTSSPCHVVDVIAGAEDELLVALQPSGSFIVIRKEMVDIGAGDFEKRDIQYRFSATFDLLGWLDAEGIVVPQSFTARLQSGFPGKDARAWRATLADVTRFIDRKYVVSWRLSCEDADTQNCETVGTVAEAFEILGSEGAMQALPGNSASIWLGSIELYSTHFRSSGIDRGDSHRDPTMQTAEGDLLEQIQAFEARQQSAMFRTPQVEEFIRQAGGDLQGEHPHHPKSVWLYEVKHEDVILGYWEWAYQKHLEG
ncbi:hypothetical protein [Paraburkholderia youngii]|uniref:hypothetical protein n=1 Tax=Paraburkholderia youngii TaxID=2782701 RepID=UPI003D1D3461